MLPIIDRFLSRFRKSQPKFQNATPAVKPRGMKIRHVFRRQSNPSYAFSKAFGGTMARDRNPRPRINLARNPSLYNVGDGLKPIRDHVFADGTRHFIFKALTALGRHVGFIHRREIGQGHSSFERFDRREKRRKDFALRRQYKRARKLEAIEHERNRLELSPA